LAQPRQREQWPAMMVKNLRFVQSALRIFAILWMQAGCRIRWWRQKTDPLVPQWKADAEFQSLAVMRDKVDFPAMFPHNTADNQEAQSRTSGFRCEVGLEDFAHVGWRDASAGVAESNPDKVVVGDGRDFQNTAGAHRLKSIFDDVEERLFDLCSVDLREGKVGAQILLNRDAPVLNLGREKVHALTDQSIDIFKTHLEVRGSDRPKKLLHDRVQSLDFPFRHLQRILEVIARGFRHFPQLAFKKL
jgi:hypothetical protein